MQLQQWVLGAVGALALSAMATTVQAAPVGAVADNLKLMTGNTSSVQKAHHHPRHHCRWRYGHPHCWWSRYSYYDDGYYPYAYGYYPYAYGPSVGIFIGGGRRHHHHHHH